MYASIYNLNITISLKRLNPYYQEIIIKIEIKTIMNPV